MGCICFKTPFEDTYVWNLFFIIYKTKQKQKKRPVKKRHLLLKMNIIDDKRFFLKQTLSITFELVSLVSDLSFLRNDNPLTIISPPFNTLSKSD